MGPLVHHHPAHARGAVLADRAVPRCRCAAAVHGLKVRGPPDEPDQPFRLRLAVIHRLRHRGALVPAEGAVQHPAGGDDLVVITAGNDRVRIPVQHAVHFGADVLQEPRRPGKALHALVIGQKLEVDLQPRIGDPADDGLGPADLPGRDGVEVVRAGVPGVVPAGDGEGVPAAEDLFVLLVPPEGDAHHHVGKAVARDPDQPVRRAVRRQPVVKGRHPVQMEGRLAADENGQVHAPLLFGVHEGLPFVNVLFLGRGLVLAGGEEEASPAPQVALVGHVVNGAADVEAGDPFVPLVPFPVEQRTHRIHDCIPAFL